MDCTGYNIKTVSHNDEFYEFKSPVPKCKKCGERVAIFDHYNWSKDAQFLKSWCPWCNDEHYMYMDRKLFQLFELPLDEGLLYEKIYYAEQEREDKIKELKTRIESDTKKLAELGENMSHYDNDTCTEKSIAREILSIIEEICFSDKFKEYRINYGSNGTRDLIIKTIQEKYSIT